MHDSRPLSKLLKLRKILTFELRVIYTANTFSFTLPYLYTRFVYTSARKFCNHLSSYVCQWRRQRGDWGGGNPPVVLKTLK